MGIAVSDSFRYGVNEPLPLWSYISYDPYIDINKEYLGVNKMEKISAEFASALIKATGEMAGAVKNATNPHFRNEYANKQAVVEAIKPHLIANGITLLQPIIEHESRCVVQTVVIYKTGESLVLGKISLPVDKQTPQAFCSAITYACRNGAAAAFFLPSIDDDGNEASGIKPTPQPTIRESLTVEPVIYYRPDLNASQEKFFKDNGAKPLNYGYWQSPKDLGPKLKKDIVSKDEYEKRAARLKESETQLQGSVDAGVEEWIQEKI